MIASLAMYDFAGAQPSNDRLWALIRDGMRAAGLNAPETLTRGTAAYWPAWQSPDLILSQTCGMPYRARLHGRVTLIGTPDYGIEGCPPGYYRSIFVARQTDPRQDLTEFDNAALAFSEDLSQSGWAAPQNQARSLGLTFRPTLRSGGHVMSARAVAEGKAEIAAIDALSWSMIQQWEPFAQALKPIAATDPTPGLPYIAASGTDALGLFHIVTEAIAALPLPDRRILRLNSFVQIPAAAYLAVATPPAWDEPGPPN